MRDGNKKEVPEHKTTFEIEIIWNIIKAIFLLVQEILIM